LLKNPFGLGIGWQVKIGNVPIDVEIGGQALPCGYQKVRLCNIGDEDLCIENFTRIDLVRESLNVGPRWSR
jgi:hypothetical protein